MQILHRPSRAPGKRLPASVVHPGVALALLLASASIACVRSASTPPPDQVATRVAEMLTTMATSTTPFPTTVTPTFTSTFFPQPLVPTPTLTPTHNPSPTAPTTPSITPSPTSTSLPADDPRRGLDLGHPQYVDDFSTPHTWYHDFADEGVVIQLKDGALQTTDLLADYFVTWSTSARQGSDVYAEITARIGSCSGKDAYALAVRVGGASYDRGYALEFSCDGSYRLRKFINFSTEPKVIVNWTPATAILAGPNSSNRMGFAAKGGDLYVLANGVLIGHTVDDDYASGFFGLYASALNTPGLTVVFDDFALWQLSP